MSQPSDHPETVMVPPGQDGMSDQPSWAGRGMSARPDRHWKRADQIAVLVWAVATIGATSLWWQWLVARTPPNAEPDWGKVLALIVEPLLVLALGLGAIAGALIRRDGPKIELLALACVGAACVVFTVSGIASSDPTQCDPNSGCDLSYGLGAMLELPFVLAPFLAGTAIGRGISVVLRRYVWARIVVRSR